MLGDFRFTFDAALAGAAEGWGHVDYFRGEGVLAFGLFDVSVVGLCFCTVFGADVWRYFICEFVDVQWFGVLASRYCACYMF